MSKYGTLVMGPAGAGKSTFCGALISHLRTVKRSAYYVNLDPAADAFMYEPDLDIRDLISLEDVMEELSLGPNGGLIYCFEFLMQNLDFLTDPLEEIPEEYLIIIDLPGQIELFTHVPVIPNLVATLTRGAVAMNLCATYLMEATFVQDRPKFFSAALSCMSSMMAIELPSIQVLSKMDLIKGQIPRKELRRFFHADAELLEDDPARDLAFDTPGDATAGPEAKDNLFGGSSFKRLNEAVGKLLDEYGLLNFLQLNVQSEESVGDILSFIDDLIQFHDAQEPREPGDEPDHDNDADALAELGL